MTGLTVIGPAALGFPPPQRSYSRVAYANVSPDEGPATWLTISGAGNVTAFAGKVEYGQGIRWGLAVEVAAELGMAPRDIEVVLGDTARVPWDMGTNGSRSTAIVGLQLRKAAATAREALLRRAADRLDLPVSGLACRNGEIRSLADPAHATSFSDLLQGDAVEIAIDDNVSLTGASNLEAMAEGATRLDALDRVTGRAIYSRDVQVPGMLFAAVLRPPTFHARLLEVDTSVAERLPGVVRAIRDDDLIAILAEDDESAVRGLQLVQATWDEQSEHPSIWDLPTMLTDGSGETAAIQQEGSLDDGFRLADEILEATFFIPYISTLPMEPRAAVASWDGDALTVWAGTQRPFGIRSELAQRLDIDESRIRVIAPEIGGGFGGKSLYRPAIEAARLSRIAGPVRVAFSRTEEMTYTTFRPAAIIQVRSGFTNDGRITAWEFKAHHTSLDRPFIGQRGSQAPYDIPNIDVSVTAAPSPLRPGSYRSLGGAVNHFAREVHMDEIATATGIDPVELRLRHLSDPRYRRVLQTAADAFGWPAAEHAGCGIGVALGWDVGSYAASCFEVNVKDREVRVERAAMALDCGLTVNPEGARSQVEGSVVMGVGTALYEGIEFEAGRILNASLARYRVPRITDAPRISVELVGDPDTPSTGAGEPGIVPVAAAISNAVFNQTGQRHRELPIHRHLR